MFEFDFKMSHSFSLKLQNFGYNVLQFEWKRMNDQMSKFV